jgi:hypothetical protein
MGETRNAYGILLEILFEISWKIEKKIERQLKDGSVIKKMITL